MCPVSVSPLIRSLPHAADFEGFYCVNVCRLFANVQDGQKPDYRKAMKSDQAKPMYEDLLAALRNELGNDRVKDGAFGAMMNVSLTNDGPVTLVVDSPRHRK